MLSNREIETFLGQSRLMLSNSRNDADIQPLLAPFGYDPERIDEGLALLDAAAEQMRTQQIEYAEQYAASTAYTEAVATLRATYARHVKLARVAFKPGTLAHSKLALTGVRRRDREGLLTQAEQFYRTLASETSLTETTARYTLDAEAVTAALAQVEAVKVAREAQAKEAGEAQQATKTRNAAIAEARAYMSDFRTIAKIALAEVPQLSERIGIIDRR